ncbi:hypothetical protein MC885_008867 [Smutsia gigantea]|nr:hypothetical protein MC885_008867 [Smutsia gigantea]
MPHFLKCPRLTFEPGFPFINEIQDLPEAQIPAAEDKEDDVSSTCSFTFSYLSTSSSMTSSPLILSTSEEEEGEEEKEGEENKEGEGEEEDKSVPAAVTLSSPQSPQGPCSSPSCLSWSTSDGDSSSKEKYKQQFPVIFKKASKCLQVISGIDVKEVDPTIHSYVLLDSLDLSHDETSDSQSMPKMASG